MIRVLLVFVVFFLFEFVDQLGQCLLVIVAIRIQWLTSRLVPFACSLLLLACGLGVILGLLLLATFSRLAFGVIGLIFGFLIARHRFLIRLLRIACFARRFFAGGIFRGLLFRTIRVPVLFRFFQPLIAFLFVVFQFFLHFLIADGFHDLQFQFRGHLGIGPRLFVVEGLDPDLDHIAGLQVEPCQFQIVFQQQPLLPTFRQWLLLNGLAILFDVQIDVTQFKVGIARFDQRRNHRVGGNLQIADRFQQRDFRRLIGANGQGIRAGVGVGVARFGFALNSIELGIRAVRAKAQRPRGRQLSSVGRDRHRVLFAVWPSLTRVKKLELCRLDGHVRMRRQSDFRAFPRFDLSPHLFGRFQLHVGGKLKSNSIDGGGRRLIDGDPILRRHRIAGADDIRQILQQSLSVLAPQKPLEAGRPLAARAQLDRFVPKLAVGCGEFDKHLFRNFPCDVGGNFHGLAGQDRHISRLNFDDFSPRGDAQVGGREQTAPDRVRDLLG